MIPSSQPGSAAGRPANVQPARILGTPPVVTPIAPPVAPLLPNRPATAASPAEPPPLSPRNLPRGTLLDITV